jgi:hypothetical protein
MFDQWMNLVLTSRSSGILVVVAFVIEQHINILEVPFDQGRRNLTIVFPRRRHV